MKKWIVLLLAVALVASVVIAQPGGRGRGGRGGAAGAGGFGGGMGNMAFGAVTEVDLDTGLLTIQGRGRGGPGGGGGQQSFVQLRQDTSIVTQEEATVDDLEVGKKLSVSGVPTGIMGSRFTLTDAGLGDIPTFGGMGMRMGGGPGGQQAPPARGTAEGEIISLNPLRLQVTDEIVVEVGATADATFVQMVEAPEGALQQGVNVLCTGERGAGGELLANSVLIMPQMQQRPQR